ncbi:class I SAM-dependent methyltransferase [Paracoccus sulfuroxidans]|uniref:Putative O-methyltransferase YrrM n=1 Tax=Paracoccus sulfuroxidans TaxID=384678 RepID=A0A562NNI9_9RHOB|nr:TylF/MycF/NovP-related O-methyltransferase [Paracoccus sulfuroxidans]TWI33765.1 putative O-methyltransferase YrrM [Paracoccus sulfuroxidans]
MPPKIGTEPEFQTLWDKVQPYTMTSRERGYALWCAINTILDNETPGAFVECGVWRGGSSMLIALTLLQRGAGHRDIYMFDTFEGMTEAGEVDVDVDGHHADALMEGIRGDKLAELVKAAAGIDGVRAAMESTGYDMRRIRMIKGDVRETLKVTQTLGIALLRLDTDFYDSTLEELRVLYPRLNKGGILIIDDFGHWHGARLAVQDYFADPECPFTKPMLWAIDYTGRGAVKIEEQTGAGIERYDYVPPGMEPPDLLPLFPFAEAQNPWKIGWQYLRKQTPHIWRSDTRHTGHATGNASAEEAACLYAVARQFEGRRGLEIGTHFGWTAAHLLAAGLRLDCMDPAIADPERKAQISEALDGVKTTGSYRLWSSLSPAGVKEVRDSAEEPYSFAFIDGDHDGEAPADDAREVLNHLAPDAVVMFHDLTSPHVAKGLAVMQDAGFKVRLYNTMQIMGVAWRGNVTIPEHVVDPNVPPMMAGHLKRFL